MNETEQTTFSVPSPGELEQLTELHKAMGDYTRIRVRHDEEQRRFLIAQRVQLQLIVHGEVPQLLDVEGGEPGTAGNQDGFCSLTRDKLSRTF